MNMRIGFGFDTHRTAEGRPMVLGGVTIPHHCGLLGHSDADVLLHAICDALLGAANLRDIGHHFPNTDKRFRGIDSRELLHQSWALVRARGFAFGNLDCTVVAEAPKINPHIAEMQRIIAGILETDTDNVSIKATTNEGMDAIGRGEGICAYAVVLIAKTGN